MEPIRLSALGRDVYVGDFYNYFNDNILPGPIRQLKQHVEISETCEVEHFFFFRLPHKYKRHVLGISSHLDENIEGGSVDFNRLWFAGYLQRQSTQDEDDNTAQVDVIFRIIRRTESLNQENFDQRKMFEYQQIIDGKATHLVEKVVYGAEFIISMRRALDLNFESKSSAEGNIYLAAKNYFQSIGPKMNMDERPAEFKKIKCAIFSSIDPGNIENGTFEYSCKLLRNLFSFKKSIYSDEKWKPIDIKLKIKFEKNLLAQIKARILSEKMSDVEFEVERNLAMLKAAIKESYVISKHPFINRVPPFEKAMGQFLDLLTKILEKIENFYSMFFLKMWSPDRIGKIENGMKSISELLTDTTDWLIDRRKEIEIMFSLLSDTKLSMSDFEEIESSVSSGEVKMARVFILKMDYAHDALIDRLAKFIGNQQESFNIPVFWIATSGKHQIEHVVQLLKIFDNLNDTSSSLDCIYQIGLVPFSSSMKNGTRLTLGCPVKFLAKATAIELSDSSILPAGNDEGRPLSSSPNSMLFPRAENSVPQGRSRFYSETQEEICQTKEENNQIPYVAVMSRNSRSNTLRSVNGKRNLVCTTAPTTPVASYPLTGKAEDGFSSPEVDIGLIGNVTSVPKKQKTLFDFLSQCFPCLRNTYSTHEERRTVS